MFFPKQCLHLGVLTAYLVNCPCLAPATDVVGCGPVAALGSYGSPPWVPMGRRPGFLWLACNASLHCLLALLACNACLQCFFALLACNASLHCLLAMLPCSAGLLCLLALLACFACLLCLLALLACFDCLRTLFGVHAPVSFFYNYYHYYYYYYYYFHWHCYHNNYYYFKHLLLLRFLALEVPRVRLVFMCLNSYYYLFENKQKHNKATHNMTINPNF